MPCFEHGICDAVRAHRVFSELSDLRAWRRADESVHLLIHWTGFDGGRRGDEVHHAAYVAHNANVNGHGWRLSHDSILPFGVLSAALHQLAIFLDPSGRMPCAGRRSALRRERTSTSSSRRVRASVFRWIPNTRAALVSFQFKSRSTMRRNFFLNSRTASANWMAALSIWRTKASSWPLVGYECSRCMSMSSTRGGIRYV